MRVVVLKTPRPLRHRFGSAAQRARLRYAFGRQFEADTVPACLRCEAVDAVSAIVPAIAPRPTCAAPSNIPVGPRPHVATSATHVAAVNLRVHVASVEGPIVNTIRPGLRPDVKRGTLNALKAFSSHSRREQSQRRSPAFAPLGDRRRFNPSQSRFARSRAKPQYQNNVGASDDFARIRSARYCSTALFLKPT